MNFLAHAYLSFNQKEIMVGNMISDFVKGKEQYTYKDEIQKGIRLHRLIDNYTDTHPLIKEAKDVFRAGYRLYSGPIVDIVLDHYLANDPDSFDEQSLKEFTQLVYRTLEQFSSHLPLRFVHVLTYMQQEDWLWNYRLKGGIERSIKGMVRRSTFLHDSETAISLMHEHDLYLRQLSERFLKDVKKFAKAELDLLNRKTDTA
ncbi:MAG TPA: ACP phosphodiesterase [Chitinophagaceae bacterium]|nr:ACP phosphodiesterase [Chitinophagaceae bacterium]